MPLRVTNCSVSNNSITITFSEPVVSDPTNTNPVCGTYPENYTIFDPGSVDFSQPQTLADVASGVATPSLDSTGRFLTINFQPGSNTISSEFQNGDWVHITVKGVTASTGEKLEGAQASFARRVPGGPPETGRATRDVEDAISYPILTEEIGYRSSPVGTPGGGGGGSLPSAGGGSNLGQVALRAVGDVLGWKPNASDPKGFVGALTQAFTLTDVEGHVESAWNPRTFAVQTDLGGGITGAQASLYTRAKDALDLSLSLLDGLYPLDPEADPEYVKALREMARSQMTQIVKELGTVGLPSILRIDTYFDILLGQHPTRHFTHVQFDPDKIKGTLGKLRDTYGIKFRGNQFNNSVEDEQDITNFRVISDYMTSLLQSWISNREFFVVEPNKLAFFGTQLVLISRQLNVIAETVNEVRFTLDSVFIGPNERQSLLLVFKDRAFPPMFVEDMLVEIENFVTNEAPLLLRDGGKISVTNNILPVVRSLRDLVIQAHNPENKDKVPDGFRTARVRRSLDDLRDQLGEVIRLTEQVEQQIPPPEDQLAITGVLATSTPDGEDGFIAGISFYGTGIDPRAELTVHSTTLASGYQKVFYSAERIDASYGDLEPGVAPLDDGEHEARVTNPGPDGASATLRFTFYWNNGSPTATPINGGNGGNGGGYGGGGGSRSALRPAVRSTAKTRSVVIETGAGEVGPAASAAGAAKPVAAAAPAPVAPVPAVVAPVAAVPAAPAPAAPVAAQTTQPVPAPEATVQPHPDTQEQIAALQKQINELKAVHESGIKRLEDLILSVSKDKDKNKKSKDDD
jgi:hypothetical protein